MPTIASSGFAVHEVVLTAGTEQIVTIPVTSPTVEVSVLAAVSPVYFTVNAATATVKGQNCFMALPGVNSVQVPTPSGSTSVEVHLISAAAATVSVIAG